MNDMVAEYRRLVLVSMAKRHLSKACLNLLRSETLSAHIGGRLKQNAIARSSGVRMLDRHTLQAFGAWEPFSPMREDVTRAN
jgi:hypothetical protein